ncbi:MGMT family protein [Arthrobacter sp. Soil763]|uniref:MGMT family protein n=1 Tax=Arthrobacter sp. Soil763 TaxID=1736402 RepID=UPI0006F48B5E|nr:MGMT family protein [Arthrobacter sp. Soil763]KRE79845.1 cysteine methyltransferase [Arthrobacter sp. Soil763]
MRTEYVEAVLELAAMVPPGTAVAYGDVSELLGAGGPRQVGAVMSHHGSTVPWWRILKANGEAPPGHERDALARYLAEGTPLLGRYGDYQRTGEGRWRVDLVTARWAPTEPEFERIDALAERLERELHKLSVPNDEMSV